MLKPANRFLLVEVEEEKDTEKTTASGIIMVEKSDTRDLQVAKGKVVGVGDEVKGYKEGQTVYYNFFSGNQVFIDEKQYHIVYFEDVLGVDA